MSWVLTPATDSATPPPTIRTAASPPAPSRRQCRSVLLLPVSDGHRDDGWPPPDRRPGPQGLLT